MSLRSIAETNLRSAYEEISQGKFKEEVWGRLTDLTKNWKNDPCFDLNEESNILDVILGHGHHDDELTQVEKEYFFKLKEVLYVYQQLTEAAEEIEYLRSVKARYDNLKSALKDFVES